MSTYSHSSDSRSLAHRMPSLPIPGHEPPRTRSRYKVWSGSYRTEEVRFTPGREEERAEVVSESP